MTSPVTDRQIRVVLDLLSDGNPHRFTEVAKAAGTNHLRSILSELRGRGHTVLDWSVETGRDEKFRRTSVWYFRLIVPSLEAAGVPSPPAASSEATGRPGDRNSTSLPVRAAA